MGKWPGGQRQLTVNQPGKPYSGSNPLLPTTLRRQDWISIDVRKTWDIPVKYGGVPPFLSFCLIRTPF